MSDLVVEDAQARERALDPTGSYIVQAPAGSGKTELLTQRVLALLGHCDQPEEILAITFTRKAAAEMRNRVLLSLQQGEGEAPAEPHRQLTWRLARAANERGLAQGWDLRLSPTRLRVQTIDSLCANLVGQLPVLSGLGGGLRTTERAQPLYLLAARRTLAALDEPALAKPLGILLPHLDNNLERITTLIAGLLPRREQWLPHLLNLADGEALRAELESALHSAVSDHLGRLLARLPHAVLIELVELADFSAEMRRRFDKLKPGSSFEHWPGSELPTSEPESLPTWRCLADLVLVQSGAQARRKPDVRAGFPAPSSATDDDEADRFTNNKERMSALLGLLAEDESTLQLLHGVRVLPAPDITDRQLAVLHALAAVLLRGVAELVLVFEERGECDFTEIHRRALQGLGSTDDPSELALRLDYQLRHVLVDEFQDTSSGQLELLHGLTGGWSQGDGRTLFLVGDPMQSIYAFRQAEVGLFLQVQQQGLGELRPECLSLRRNFRSDQGIVDWVNQAFERVLPAQDNAGMGAVSYSPAIAVRPAGDDPAVSLHGYAGRDDALEASELVAQLRRALDDPGNRTLAVLVRSRPHLRALVPELKAAGLPFQAVDIDPLAELPAVQDLWSLTRALLHRADRLAWLSLLRSPVIGLQLADLTTLAGFDGSLWQACDDEALRSTLSADGRERLARVVPTLGAALREVRRRPLRVLIESTWSALGGEALARSGGNLAGCLSFLDLLAACEQGNELPDFADFEAQLTELYAPVDAESDGSVQLMTIHKSKGLEFDAVFLPGLGKAPRADQPDLFNWCERPTDAGHTELLMAPIRASSETDSPVVRFVASVNKDKARHEDGRLLYVAATRARRRLHLFGHIGRKGPANGSLLHGLWPAVGTDFDASEIEQGETQDAGIKPVFTRVVGDWCPDRPEDPLRSIALPASAAGPSAPPVPFEWAGQQARLIGQVTHGWLQRIANDGIEQWPVARLDELTRPIRNMLRNLGIEATQLDAAADRVLAALSRTLRSDRGRWILSDHQDARCELSLSTLRSGELKTYVIDRTFTDEDGTTWIIDYKTSRHEGGDTDAFLDEERERYRDQLENYRELLAAKGHDRLRVGLYFPLLDGWRSW